MNPDDARFLEEMRIFSSTGCIDEFDHRLRRLLRIVEGLRERLSGQITANDIADSQIDALKSKLAEEQEKVRQWTESFKGLGAQARVWAEELAATKSKLADAEARIKKAFQIIEGYYKSPLSGEFACGTGCDMGAAGPGPDGQHDPDCRIKALYELLKEMEAKH